jgi:hypothetical protein
MPTENDPLRCIPSARIVRRRLLETEAEAAKLRILLDTAERIERVASMEPELAGTREPAAQ